MFLMYRVELKARLRAIAKARITKFLMYRVELKGRNNAKVDNKPPCS